MVLDGGVLAPGVEVPLTKRCVSSASSSLSSNASARSELDVESWCMEDVVEWNDGGGELGMVGCCCESGMRAS